MRNSPSRMMFLALAFLLTSGLAGCGGADGARPFGGESGGRVGGGTGGDAVGDDGGTAGESGTGGMVIGSGGLSGSGGDIGSGGSSGTGGRATGSGGHAMGGTAVGGRIGSGGRTGGAGGPGTGGKASTGGQTGSGGLSASGGATGTGGSGPDPSKCDQISSEYTKAMPAAKACTLGAAGQCQSLVPGSLGCLSSCRVYVQTPAPLNDIAKKWTAEGCDSIGRVCPAIACLAPQSGVCAQSTGSASPQCQNGSIVVGPPPVTTN